MHSLFTHLAANWKIEVTGLAVALGLGSLANDVTAPKVLAIMVFLSDWNMLYTWEWWTRMIIFLAIGTTAWWLQKRKSDRQLKTQADAAHQRESSLQRELGRVENLLAHANTRIAILEGRKK